MKQVLIIHGGSSYLSHQSYLQEFKKQPLQYERLLYAPKWREWLAQQLPDSDVLLPSFPNKDNAQYEEWKLYFEKILPFLQDDVSIVGHSLGAMFLANYFEEHTLPVKVRQIILIAGRYGGADIDTGQFRVSSSKRVAENAESVHLFHSEDDHVVPFDDLQKFQNDLPHATVHRFTNRGHFNEPTFPELLELLKQK